MKTFILILTVLLFTSTRAQITLEREIPDSNTYFSLIQVDSGEYYYMLQGYGDSSVHNGVDIKLFDLDFNLVKEIDIQIPLTGYDFITYVSRRLFDLDDEFEFVVYRLLAPFEPQLHFIKILKETGAELFSCENCSFGYDPAIHTYEWQRGIYNTSRGAKMLIMKHYYLGTPPFPGNQIYSLPGKLPTSSAAPDDIAYIQSALQIETFPNPASGDVQVSYQLPPGTTAGYIAIRDTKGAELQRHRINNFDQHLSLDTRDLSPGSYYCCLLTEDGRTAVKKMMVVR
jgi:hypothetical protein